MTSGVLGPVGFTDMCLGCGSVSNSFGTLWGYPFCAFCKGSCQSAAQARKLWRTHVLVREGDLWIVALTRGSSLTTYFLILRPFLSIVAPFE